MAGELRGMATHILAKTQISEDRVVPDNQAIEAAPFSVVCAKCGASAPVTAGDRRPSMQCPACGGAIDLTTDEVKHARQAAAAKASIQTHQGRG
jgi:rRNA maturation endonuclease Nob1